MASLNIFFQFQNLLLLGLAFADLGWSTSRKICPSELTSATCFLKWSSHWQITVLYPCSRDKVKYIQFTTFSQPKMFNYLLTTSGKTKPRILTSLFLYLQFAITINIMPWNVCPLHYLNFPAWHEITRGKNKQSYLQGKQRLL